MIASKVPAIETSGKWVDKYGNWLVIYAGKHTSEGKEFIDGFKVCFIQV
jgi:hypothetical protein